MRIYRVELLKFSMIDTRQLNNSLSSRVQGKRERLRGELSGVRELWQPVGADCKRGAQATRTPFSPGHIMAETDDTFTEYGDDHLTFFALIYKNYDATAECLGDLRKHYSSSRVILRSDGDSDPRFPPLAERHKVDFRAESRLFGIENGGAVIERMLVMFLEKPTRYLFKIDPDTVIHRRFKYLPVRSGLFGTLQLEHVTPSVQGGCMGFTRDAAEQILQSEMLRDRRLREPAKFIDDSPYFFRMADRANRCA